MIRVTHPSLRFQIVCGLTLLVGAALLASFLVWHSGTVALDALAPTRFMQTAGPVTDLAFSQDGRLMMATEGDYSHPLLTFRDSTSGSVVRQWPGGRGDTWLSDDGQRVIETEPPQNGPTRCLLRDAVSGRPLRRWTGQIIDVRPDFTQMVTCDDLVPLSSPGTPPSGRDYVRPKIGRVVDVSTGHVLGQFRLPIISYGTAHLSRTSPYLCLSNNDEAAALLRVPGMTPALTGLPPLRSLRVTRDGTRAFGVDKTGTLHFWRLPSGEHTTIASGLYRTDWVSELPNGDLIVQGTAGSNVDPHNQVRVRSSDGTRLLRCLPGSAEAFSPDGRLVAFEHGYQSQGEGLAVWDCETGQRVVRLDADTDALGRPGPRHYFGLGQFVISPDGRRFALGTPDGLLRFYNLSH